MKKYYLSLIIKICAIAIMVAVDLITKSIVENYFVGGGNDIILIEGVLGLTYALNTGAAFGFLGNSTVLLIIFSIIFLCVFTFIDVYYKSLNGWYVAGFSLIVGGALGNFFDRIMLKHVRDFVEIKFINFPIFNLADVFLTVGVICYVVYLVFYEFKKLENNKKDITKEG